MGSAVSQSPFNLKEEGGGLDRCHYAPTADCCSRDCLLPSMNVIEIVHQLFALRAAYSSSFTRTSFISLISVITIA